MLMITEATVIVYIYIMCVCLHAHGLHLCVYIGSSQVLELDTMGWGDGVGG